MPQTVYKKRHDSGPVIFVIYDENNRVKNLNEITKVGIIVYNQEFKLAESCDDSTLTIRLKSKLLDMVKVDDILIINDERFLVTSIPIKATGETNVTRGYDGTDPATHDAYEQVTLLKVENLDGSKASVLTPQDSRLGRVTVNFDSTDLNAVGTFYVEFELYTGTVKTTFPDLPNALYMPILVVSADGNNA